jgi:hypothetical protein
MICEYVVVVYKFWKFLDIITSIVYKVLCYKDFKDILKSGFIINKSLLQNLIKFYEFKTLMLSGTTDYG